MHTHTINNTDHTHAHKLYHTPLQKRLLLTSTLAHPWTCMFMHTFILKNDHPPAHTHSPTQSYTCTQVHLPNHSYTLIHILTHTHTYLL